MTTPATLVPPPLRAIPPDADGARTLACARSNAPFRHSARAAVALSAAVGRCSSGRSWCGAMLGGVTRGRSSVPVGRRFGLRGYGSRGGRCRREGGGLSRVPRSWLVARPWL